MKIANNSSCANRKPYLKPRLRQVRLRPEEAVLGNCKMGTMSGPNTGGGNCSMPSACSAQGS